MTRSLALTALVIPVLLLACSEAGSDFPEVEGWTRTGAVLTYDADQVELSSRLEGLTR